MISQVEIYFAFDTDTTNGDPWNLWTYEKDTTNEKQTVTIPAITNTYVSADNVSYTDTGISDQVNLTGLTRGNTYTLVGKIIDKSTGKVVSKSRKCTYGKDAYDITNVVPADEGNYTVNRLDTYNVYLLKKDVSSSGETAKQGYYRLNDEGTKYVLCTESGQVLDDSNGIKKDLFENEILYPGDEFKEVTELIAKKSFVPSGSESQQHVDFTFDPEELAGKNYVITQDLYFDKLQDAGTVFDDETADVYAVLYSDGTLSFQKRKDTYPSKTVVEVYPFNESTHFPTIDSVLWKNNALNVKSVEFRDKIRPVSTARWFNGFENATSINLKNLDTSRDTNMNKMFSYCKGLTKLDVSGLDTSQVTDMDAMFAVCINLTNIPVSNFNTSKVKDMHSMFDNCFKLQSLDLSMFDTSNVTDFGYMFSGDKVMSTLHLTDNFVTEKAKDISGIFNDCEKLSNINVSNWNVSNVTSTEKAFANNFLLKSLDLSNWDMSNCENSQMMFYSDTALTSIGNTSNWNVSKITTTHSMFEGCSKLQSLNTSKWVFSNLTNADSMFSNCQVLTKLDTSNWGMGKVIYFGFLFNNCYALTSLNVSKWDTSNANIFNAMFNECVNLTNIDVSNWKTSNVTQAVNTFLDCKKLTQVAVQNWDMSNVSQLSGMFAYCSGITSLDISKWNAPKLIEINNTFNGLTKCTSIKIKGMYAPNIDTCINTFLDCTSLTSLDLSGLGMSKATSFNGMFGRMSNITSINLSGWSTSNVTDTTNMFTECRKLKTIYVSEGWSVAKVKSDTYMFSSCTSIRGGSGKTYNRNQLGKSMANYSNGYLTYKAYTAKANIAAPSSSVIISSAKATDGLTVEEILNNDSVFTDPIRAVNEENTDTENEDVDTQNADVAVQSMDDPSGKLLYSHSDLNDENETFYVPKVQTVLTNTANDHYFTTAAGSTLVDTVTYSGLKPGRAYTLTGKLMDKDTGKAATDKSGKEITGTATFTPSTANGTAKVNFSFDGSNLKGKTLVAYETLNGISVAYGIASSKKDLAIHKDISDADQSVTNMSLSTTAKDQKSGTKQVTLSRTAKIDDTVSYKGAIRGTSYKINGTLMNKSTGEAAVDGDGKPITASGVFTAGSATGTATATFTFNTNGMAGGAYVAFEEVYETTGGKETLWGTHMDLNDEAQTVYVPSISTNLIDENSQTNYTYIRDNVKAHDLVTYEGLIAGKTYKLTGTLVEKSTGKTFVDANGKTATITQTFTPDSDSGSVDMVFDINPSNLKTSALVAFETLSCNGEQVTIENDLDNEQQTLHFPILSTTAKGKVSGKNYVDIGGDMSIIDTIKYEGVQYGMTHTIKSYLVDKTTGKIVQDDNGNDIVKTTEWEPEATQGSIDVEIPVTGKKLAGRTLVVFEEIYLGDAMIACHKDINDASQTVTNMGISTVAKDKASGSKQVTLSSKTTITDTVSYKGAVAGYKYQLQAVLMDKLTGEAAVDGDGQPITGSKDFTASATSGSAAVDLTFNGAGMPGGEYVVYETLYRITDNGSMEKWASHEDMNDENQLVNVPGITTQLVDAATNTQFVKASSSVNAVDTVYYEGLIPGQSYTLTGQLIEKATGKVFVDGNGKEMTVTKTFTPAEKSGEVDVEFTLNATNLNTSSLVAYETLSLNGKEIVSEKSLDNEYQTLSFPVITSTTAVDKRNGTKVIDAQDDMVIVDTISYTGMQTGLPLTVKSTIMDKATGKAAKDSDGNDIIVESEILPDETNGSIDVEIPIKGRNLMGKTLVVYEEICYADGVVIAQHKNLKDAGQTVTVAGITTTAAIQTTAGQNDRYTSQTVRDTIKYYGLTKGTSYTLQGTLMDKATGNAYQENGKDVTASKTFKASATSGTETLDFEISSSEAKNRTLVVCESVYTAVDGKQVLVAQHSDLTDKDQTVEVPDETVGKLKVTKTIQNGDKNKAFKFTITLKGSRIKDSMMLSGVTFTNGVGTISLKHGESKLIEDIPSGTTYRVVEEQSGLYRPIITTGDAGTIEDGKTAEASFVNIHLKEEEPGEDEVNLTVSKKVLPEDAGAGEKFQFTAVFDHLRANWNYGLSDKTEFQSDADGKATVTFTLGKGENVTFLHLPAGCTYRFTEAAGAYTSSYAVTDAAGLQKIATASGANTEEDQEISTATETADKGEKVTVTFTNEFQMSQDLTLTKKTVNADGSAYNAKEAFSFTVKFTGLPANAVISSTAGDVTADASGNAAKNISLKNGEQVIFHELPVGSKYQITESGSEYRPSYSIDAATVVKKTDRIVKRNSSLSTQIETIDKGEDDVVTFTNERIVWYALPNTGSYMLVILIGASLIMLMIASRKRKDYLSEK